MLKDYEYLKEIDPNKKKHISSFYELCKTKKADKDKSFKNNLRNLWYNNKNEIIWNDKLSPRQIEYIDKKLKSSEPILDEELQRIDITNNTKITFLLGAGASKPSNIPTVNELLPELWKRAKKIGRDDLDKLIRYCDSLGIENIEDLLTAAYLSEFAAKNPDVNNLLNYFLFSGRKELVEYESYRDHIIKSRQISKIDLSSISFLQDTLQTLFGLLTSTMISASPNKTHKSIEKFIKERKNIEKENRTFIITTNYDGCMDEALAENFDSNEIDDILIKMHGSINWAYCESCHDVKKFDLAEVKRIYDEDILSYPVMGICKKCRGLRRPLLVPPMSFKFLNFPNLIDIWSTAQKRIREANYIIVVGYSFSEADTYISKIIAKSMSDRKNQKMIVVDTNPDLVEKLRNRYSAHVENFDETRILRAWGSCEKTLPKILDSIKSDNRKINQDIAPKTNISLNI